MRACVPVSASDHGKPSTYGQKHESMCTGTARDHDLLHRDDDACDREAELCLAKACNVAILVGVVFVVVEFFVSSQDRTCTSIPIGRAVLACFRESLSRIFRDGAQVC